MTDAAQPTSSSSSPAGRCSNCGAAVETPYCGHCGQRTGARPLAMREILADVIEDQLSVNGTLVRTVVPLVTRPGLLTREYLDGRILRYIPPFRIFLACMAVWLLAVTYQVAQAEKARRGLPVKPVHISLPVDTLGLPAFARAPLRPVARRYAEINAMEPGQAVRLVEGAFLRSSSRVFLLLMPITAALLKLVYVRRRRLFAEHFVFTLHLHAFAFAVLALLAILPRWWPITVAGNLWLALYALFAMKRVYGDGWVGTFLHSAGFGLLYMAAVAMLNPVIVAAMLTTG